MSEVVGYWLLDYSTYHKKCLPKYIDKDDVYEPIYKDDPAKLLCGGCGGLIS